MKTSTKLETHVPAMGSAPLMRDPVVMCNQSFVQFELETTYSILI